MNNELQRLESERADAIRTIELARQRAIKIADAEYMADALSVDVEYERRKADLMKGDRAVPQVPLFSEDDEVQAIDLEGPSTLFPKGLRVSGVYRASEMEHVGPALICYLLQSGIAGMGTISTLFTELGIRARVEYDQVSETRSIIWGIGKKASE